LELIGVHLRYVVSAAAFVAILGALGVLAVHFLLLAGR
jgi:hypothetical protein